MSYEIVKKIRIEGDKVFITSESNNVFPKYYKERESSYCNELLKEGGMEALNLSLLQGYEDGTLQPGIENKWSRAISRLKCTPEYQKYNWRNSNYAIDNCPIREARKTNEFNAFLLSALSLKPAKDKYIVKKEEFGTDYFVYRVTKSHIKYRQGRENAKVFIGKEQAQRIVNMFPQYQLIAL